MHAILALFVFVDLFFYFYCFFTLCNRNYFFICSKKNSILLRTQLSVRVHTCIGEFIIVLNLKQLFMYYRFVTDIQVN